jgi:catechol 2,3-dioxygenase-like lactoylglutathione lyase family enzyme
MTDTATRPASPRVGLNHVSIAAHDLEESIAFYTEVFGLERIPSPEFGFPVEWLLAGDRQLHLFQSADPPPSGAHLSFEVEDPVAVYRAVKERGLLHTPFGYCAAELPGGELQLYLKDPTGNLVEVNHPRAASFRDEIPELVVLAERQPQGPENAGASLFVARP